MKLSFQGPFIDVKMSTFMAESNRYLSEKTWKISNLQIWPYFVIVVLFCLFVVASKTVGFFSLYFLPAMLLRKYLSQLFSIDLAINFFVLFSKYSIIRNVQLLYPCVTAILRLTQERWQAHLNLCTSDSLPNWPHTFFIVSS